MDILFSVVLRLTSAERHGSGNGKIWTQKRQGVDEGRPGEGSEEGHSLVLFSCIVPDRLLPTLRCSPNYREAITGSCGLGCGYWRLTYVEGEAKVKEL